MAKHKKVVKPESRYRHLIILGVLIVLMFLLRVIGPYKNVFIGDDVIFMGNDAWYHIRLAENMIGNFPNPMFFDKYTGFPVGSDIIIPPMMSWIIIISSYIVGFGHLTVHTVQVVGAWIPPIMAALTMIPVYIIGREIHNKWTGVLAVAIAGLMPTAFLHRSMLGFTDHHILEVLFLTTTVMFVTLAYRKSQLKYYMFAGISLGMFHLSWQGAIYGLFIIWAWIVIQFVWDYKKNQSVDLLWKGSTLMLGISALMHLPWLLKSAMPIDYTFIPTLAFATPFVLFLFTKFLNSKQLIIALISIGLVGFIGGYLIIPESIGLIGYAISWNPGARTISETLAMLPQAAFMEYGANLVLFFGGMSFFLIKRKMPLLVVLWSMYVFISVSTQCRWDYYFNIVIAIMSAFFFTTLGVYFIKEVRKGISLVLVVALLFITTPTAISMSTIPSLMNADWYNALNVLRENTEEPFDTEDSYYQTDLQEEAKYGVMSWWDYGHWITQISHRVPVSNPFQQHAIEAGEFFVLGKEVEGVKYVIVDIPMYTGKYYAMLSFIGQNPVGVTQAPDDSHIMKLVRGELPNYVLVYENATVKIFEKV